MGGFLQRWKVGNELRRAAEKGDVLYKGERGVVSGGSGMSEGQHVHGIGTLGWGKLTTHDDWRLRRVAARNSYAIFERASADHNGAERKNVGPWPSAESRRCAQLPAARSRTFGPGQQLDGASAPSASAVSAVILYCVLHPFSDGAKIGAGINSAGCVTHPG